MDLRAFDLDETSRSIIDREVVEGRYSDAREIVRAALLMLQDRGKSRCLACDALKERESGWQPAPFDFTAFIAHKLEAEANARQAGP